MALTADLTGRRLIVTGASSGIGAATCRTLAGCGASVAMLARRKDKLDELCDELGQRTIPIRCDVTDFAALETAVDKCALELGGLDGVISVAGQAMVGTIETGTPQIWREHLDVNLVGPLALVRYSLRHFPKSGRRDVVLVGSVSGLQSLPGTALYSASKRGLKAAFDSLRLELAQSGINTSFVVPGSFATDILTLEGLVFDGTPVAPDTELMTAAGTPSPPSVLADTIAYMIGLPEGTCIHEIVIRPTGHLHP
jgi:NADP-dependent 3-hydroxy acid dehydrogenase YdfG